MTDAIETIEYKNHTIEILPDMNSESPREWDNLCEIHSCHTRYNLGDGEFNYNMRNDYDENRFNNMLKEAKRNKDIILSLYSYEHGNIALSLSNDSYPFNCRWDSGQVGYVIIRRKKIIEEFLPSKKRLTLKVRERAMGCAKGEIRTYNQYLCGDTYGYSVKNEDSEVDSCWGYYGIEDAITEAKSVVDYQTKEVKV